mmetsp:Transcript_31187/g.93035  ORF Transcript_31187/g.93035 Transcript_31187/m.93035 type:complete len:748 (-) Transcript_31187:305-2548(-)
MCAVYTLPRGLYAGGDELRFHILIDVRYVVHGSGWRDTVAAEAERYSVRQRRKGKSLPGKIAKRKQIRFSGFPSMCTAAEGSRVRDALLMMLSDGKMYSAHLNDAPRAHADYGTGWLGTQAGIQPRSSPLLGLFMDGVLEYVEEYDVFEVQAWFEERWGLASKSAQKEKALLTRRSRFASVEGNVGRMRTGRTDAPLTWASPGERAPPRTFVLHGGDDGRRVQADKFRDCFKHSAGTLALDGLKAMLAAKRNVYIQGAAGTGKSHLIKHVLLSSLCQVHGVQQHAWEKHIALTSSTGLSAINIGGRTVHSALGVGFGVMPLDQILAGMHPDQRGYLRSLDAIIIDEGSMLSHMVMDHADAVLRAVRGKALPWGGLQVVFVADMLQLGPIGEWFESGRPGARLHNGKFYDRRPPPWCFQAAVWPLLQFVPCLLMTLFRHASDLEWARMLDLVARGAVYGPQFDVLREKLVGMEVVDTAVVDACRIFSTRKQVEVAEAVALVEVRGAEQRHVAVDVLGEEEALGMLQRTQAPRGVARDGFLDGSELFPSMTATPELTLKVGAQVLLLQNMHGSEPDMRPLVNGSRGVVRSYVRVQDTTRVVWAVNVPVVRRADYVHEVLARVSSGTFMFPLVEFANGRVEVLLPCRFTLQAEDGTVLGVRYQVPLLFAYAFTIHKSQCMTLDKVVADCRAVFAPGQLYVAWSRTRMASDLRVVKVPDLRVLEGKGMLVDVDVLRFLHGLNWHRVHLSLL